MLLFIALLTFVLLLRYRGRIGPFVWDAPGDEHPGRVASSGRPGPESILAQRLANGEITPEDYLERLSLLQEK